MDANELRRVFTDFFVERGHKRHDSMGLIPHHPKAPMFANAGMNQFLPVILGEEPPPQPPNATSIQKSVRLSGKHNDIEELGRTRRHLTFFEMMGNFSFGDYFKERAIPLAWELVTDVVGFDGDRLWITVHETDDEAEAIWHETVGVPMERIQRLGKHNFWQMGDTGPCGPCSEIHLDCGPEWGEGGGPAKGSGDRFVEFWNLVFMQYDRDADGNLHDLPLKIIDTGGGLERWLMLLQDVPTVFDTDVVRPLIGTAERVTGRTYGDDDQVDVALRVIGDHARSMVFLVNDGVMPSNEERGYILRSVIRRAVRRGYQLGVERPILADLVATTVDVMGDAYSELRKNQDWITTVITREEERFHQTLAAGSTLLDNALSSGGAQVPGDVAFKLHDTYGFPVELTKEIAAERGVAVDEAGFEQAMEEQRRRARDARKATAGTERPIEAYREVLEQFGASEFTGYQETESKGRVLAVIPGPDDTVEVFLDRTPFYAEAGGQVGDTGVITSDSAAIEVIDTTYALPGLIRHHARLIDGELTPGEEVVARVDVERRDDIRRNHTGTHLLHWALREVLGPHVKQHGSLVAPDRLRFDFSHYGPVTPEELARVEALANAQVLGNAPVRAYETTKEEAERVGAIAFFEEKYGDVVRVLEAGDRSLELCGGTHVHALGTIGPIKIVSEGSIGANLRRIEALTGTGALEHFHAEEAVLTKAAELLRARPDEVPERIERTLEELHELQGELKVLKRQGATQDAPALAAEARDGVVVARRDGTTRDELRDLAVAVRDQPGVRAVVLGGVPEGGGVALVAATRKDSGLAAPELIAEAARLVGGGGGGKNPELAMAGGKDASRLDEALAKASEAASATA
jgi:alanyl-tRNA synthetase